MAKKTQGPSFKDISWHYVNLASRPDRKEHAEKEFAKVGIKPNRFEALTPDQWTGTELQVAQMQATTPGAIGCYASQVEVMRKAVGTDGIVAVCEDDVCFCDDLQERLDYLDTHVTWDWDIFYLGATFHAPGVWYKHQDCADWGGIGCDVKPTKDPHILRTYGIWSTYCYLVNGRNAQKVIDTFDANIHHARGIDHLAIILGPSLNTYCFVPGCSKQYDNASNIGEGITRFSQFSSLGPYWFAENMNDFDPRNFNWESGKHNEI